MPTYEVITTEIHTVSYYVPAESPEAARALVEEGDALVDSDGVMEMRIEDCERALMGSNDPRDPANLTTQRDIELCTYSAERAEQLRAGVVPEGFRRYSTERGEKIPDEACPCGISPDPGYEPTGRCHCVDWTAEDKELVRFKPYEIRDGDRAYGCPTCAAIVAWDDIRRHIRWHVAQAEAQSTDAKATGGKQ